MEKDLRTVWCGNLSSKVTEDLLYELLLQAGPLEDVKIPKDRDSRPRGYGFVTYKHDVSVDYALDLFKGTWLYNRELRLDRKVRPLPPSLPEQSIPPQMLVQQLMPFVNNVMMGGMMPNLSYGMPFGYPPPYSGQDQNSYHGPSNSHQSNTHRPNTHPSNNRRNNPRRHPYRRH